MSILYFIIACDIILADRELVVGIFNYKLAVFVYVSLTVCYCTYICYVALFVNVECELCNCCEAAGSCCLFKRICSLLQTCEVYVVACEFV